MASHCLIVQTLYALRACCKLSTSHCEWCGCRLRCPDRESDFEQTGGLQIWPLSSVSPDEATKRDKSVSKRGRLEQKEKKKEKTLSCTYCPLLTRKLVAEHSIHHPLFEKEEITWTDPENTMGHLWKWPALHIGIAPQFGDNSKVNTPAPRCNLIQLVLSTSSQF